MVARTFQFSDETDQALQTLAYLTGIEGENCIGQLVRDALRTHEWVVSEQVEGRTVVALERQDIDVLEASPHVNGERESLAAYVDERHLQEARQYFRVAAPAVSRA